ncbi:alpha-glucan phosphorylase [Barnesiella viscericola DSM 18177]|uniref:Alpha-glucan phosphorylase n=1 Tax=Barnesiella viscericola DSM 18177 TaxID=880074 RepID=W0ERI2_9BACT|nr:alpha-glucan family phosphorylase [Barnesiella viscericola]AHF11804.1 alpha-glucan phosphorylase [Barnesiella viscericola DSM 18177]
MKVQVSNTNTPNWRDITVKSQVPAELSCLAVLAKNLWWSWNSEAKNLFKSIDKDLWKAVHENPVLFLQRIGYERLEEITKDKQLMHDINEVYEHFEKYINVEKRKDVPSISYFSMEYGLSHVLKIYSGGLGILAGDYLKEASDSNVDMTAVGFLYRYGYFTQTLSMDGQQIANYEAQNFNQLPIEQMTEKDGRPMVLEVPYPGRIVYAHIWRVNVGRIKLYLLDTDLDSNSEWDRSITYQLYGGDWENRMKQEYLLGIGGILMLNKLGIKTDLYHCNEGHAALLNVQRLVDYVQNDHLKFSEALEVVRASSLYTVHTPVPAGHDYFDESLFGKYMGEFPAKLGIEWKDLMNMGRENPDTNEKFSMSVFACNSCQEVNGVSWLHGKVSQKMFQPIWKGYSPDELHVGYVTNGVHMPTWAASEWKEFYVKTFGPDFMDHQSDPKMWEKIYDVDDEIIWNIRQTLKNKFVKFVKDDFRETWLKNQGDPSRIVSVLEKINPNALLIGFARRFATYKRAHLLFTDLDRLSKIVNNPNYPVQFIFSGKAHPADGAGQGLIKRIVEISRMPQFLGKIIFLENYDMKVAKRLISGVDIWLNTPTRPLEASGTSGEKAEMNGVLNFSVLDGWWYEGYKEGAGWALTDKRTFQDQNQQDQLDAATIYSMLENQIVPLYFAKNSKGYSPEWIQYIKNSIAKIAPHFTMERMLHDYIDRFYMKEGKRTKLLKADHYAKAKEIAAWKEEFVSKWNDIEICSVSIPDGLLYNPHVGEEYEMTVVIDNKGLGNCLGVELVIANVEEGNTEPYKTIEMKPVQTDGTKVTYKLRYLLNDSGVFRYSFRMFPQNPDLPHRQDLAYVRWF